MAEIDDVSDLKKLRMNYAGMANLLAEIAVYLPDGEESEEWRDQVHRALSDYCRFSGWTFERTLNRFDLLPPSKGGQP